MGLRTPGALPRLAEGQSWVALAAGARGRRTHFVRSPGPSVRPAGGDGVGLRVRQGPPSRRWGTGPPPRSSGPTLRPGGVSEPSPTPGSASGTGPHRLRPDLELSLPHVPSLPPPLLPSSEERAEDTTLMFLLRDGETAAQSLAVGGPRSPSEAGTAPGRDRPRRSVQCGRVHGLTSSTTRPSGCPSAPTSRYTSGFREEDDGLRALPPPLQARAAGRRSGAERGTGSRPSKRGRQRSASIAGAGRGGRPRHQRRRQQRRSSAPSGTSQPWPRPTAFIGRAGLAAPPPPPPRPLRACPRVTPASRKGHCSQAGGRWSAKSFEHAPPRAGDLRDRHDLAKGGCFHFVRVPIDAKKSKNAKTWLTPKYDHPYVFI